MKQAGNQRHWLSFGIEHLGMLGILIVLITFFGFSTDSFFTPSTFKMLYNQIPSLTVIVVGMTFALVVAGIDLSVGSVAALSGTLAGVAMTQWEWSLPAAALAALLTGLLCGAVNGVISVLWSVPSFIVTLGMLEIARGAAYWVANSQMIYIGAPVEWLAEPMGALGLSPAFIVAFALVVIGQIVLVQTVFGRYAIAIGTNEEVVRLSGVDPRLPKIAVFALSGLLAGLGGLFYAARLSAADPNGGVGLELSAIAAVVIGGTSLMGGRGSVVNSFIGVLIISVIEIGLIQIGATEPIKRIVTGVVIVLAVVADVYRRKLYETMD